MANGTSTSRAAPRTVTFRRGQVVVWPRSPDGTAQVDELLRRRVVLLYRRRGKVCRATVAARRVDAVQRCHQLLPGFAGPDDNPLGRGIVRKGREKTFVVEAAWPAESRA